MTRSCSVKASAAVSTGSEVGNAKAKSGTRSPSPSRYLLFEDLLELLLLLRAASSEEGNDTSASLIPSDFRNSMPVVQPSPSLDFLDDVSGSEVMAGMVMFPRMG